MRQHPGTLADQLRSLGFHESDGSAAESSDDEEQPPQVFALAGEGGPGDEELFRQVVGPVRPLASKGGRMRFPSRSIDPASPARSDRETVEALEDLCRRGFVSLRVRREYVEEWVAPQGRLYLDALGRGGFAIQAHLDLHGLGLDAARRELEAFIVRSVKAGHRAVRVVHGRGRHSPGGRPLMKENVERWLRERRIGRFVLAYTSARRVDGGCGAVYVLLRG